MRTICNRKGVKKMSDEEKKKLLETIKALLDSEAADKLEITIKIKMTNK